MTQLSGVLEEQLHLLEARFTVHKVETATKVFGLTLAAPAALQVLSSALSVPVFQPAAVISALALTAAEYLAARESRRAERDAAPWAYLLDLKGL